MAKRVLISLPDADLRRIDRVARDKGLSRSAYIRQASLVGADGSAAAISELNRLSKLLPSITTKQAIAARDKGRRF